MSEYAKLISQGVYCKSCGSYTGEEPGYPILCNKCYVESSDMNLHDVIERGDEI